MKNTNQPKRQIESISVSQSSHYSGPLPMPEDLEKYDKVVPGAAERIISMAEKEMKHRHDNDDFIARNIVRTTYISIFFAFVSVVILSGLTFFALYKGYDKVAGAIAVGSIAAVAGVFIFFKRNKGKE